MNAKEVRALMPKKTEEIIEEITKKCAELAKEGKTEYKTWYYDFGSKIETDAKQQEILDRLHELGFKAKHAVEFGQFANAYLYVSWEETQ